MPVGLSAINRGFLGISRSEISLGAAVYKVRDMKFFSLPTPLSFGSNLGWPGTDFSPAPADFLVSAKNGLYFSDISDSGQRGLWQAPEDQTLTIGAAAISGAIPTSLVAEEKDLADYLEKFFGLFKLDFLVIQGHPEIINPGDEWNYLMRAELAVETGQQSGLRVVKKLGFLFKGMPSGPDSAGQLVRYLNAGQADNVSAMVPGQAYLEYSSVPADIQTAIPDTLVLDPDAGQELLPDQPPPGEKTLGPVRIMMGGHRHESWLWSNLGVHCVDLDWLRLRGSLVPGTEEFLVLVAAQTAGLQPKFLVETSHGSLALKNVVEENPLLIGRPGFYYDLPDGRPVLGLNFF